MRSWSADVGGLAVLLGRQHDRRASRVSSSWVAGRRKCPVAEGTQDVVDALLPLQLGIDGRATVRRVCPSRGDRTGGVYFRNARGTVSAGGFMIRSRTRADRKAASITFSAAARYISTRIGGVESTSPMLSKP